MHSNVSEKNSSKSKALKNKNITTLICGACFLTFSALANAEQNNLRVNESYTSTQNLIGADAWSATPRSEKTLTDNSNTNADSNTIEPRHILWFGNDFWITDIGTLLYKDADRDGYFSGFSLTIDADTQYSHAEVYAAIDVLLPEGSRERLHTTGTFNLYGNSLTDEYRIDIDLVQNYPIGEYDLFVDLVDAYDDRVVDRVDASQFSNLGRLPLESEEFDNQPVVVHPVTPSVPHSPVNNNIRVVEHAGSLNWWILLSLGFSVSARIWQTRGKLASRQF